MITTEKDAKTKACCGSWVNIYIEGDGGTQREKCAAGGCMAWRWYDGEKTCGYCGLAGAP